MAEVGNIKIADEVVAIIASKAATNIDGVHKMSGNVADEVNKFLGKKNSAKGIKVEVGEKECTVDAYIVVDYGKPIPEVANAVQQNIIKEITMMTGLNVVEVNVYIQDLHFPTDDKEKIESEEGELIEEAY
ncbi:MAG: hypothetical protein PWP46_1803 [Fusobacteriaceae bacterium]|jgi:uncharacterized alkaline shock family protein YloU|nr:hypothetical protein [Fusobacteriaceae bacterium]